MEDTLRANANALIPGDTFSLNPCFNGRYSQSNKQVCEEWTKRVLILVLMEDTLRALEILSLTTVISS